MRRLFENLKALFKVLILCRKARIIRLLFSGLLPEDEDLRSKQVELSFKLRGLILEQIDMIPKDGAGPVVANELINEIEK